MVALSLFTRIERGGRPAVKLSDNPQKALGDPDEIARHLRVFGQDGYRQIKVKV